MVFSSVIFLVYFLPLFLLLYFIVPKRLKNPVLLVSSMFFYAWGAPLFISAIIITTTIDFYFVKLLYRTKEDKKRKLWLVLSLSLNVGMLFYFKYCNFFIENINALFNAFGLNEVSWTKVILPIGISFYTFESITYVVDVYRGLHKPLNNFWHYQLYIICFPKLIAGPIIRYHEISDQIVDRSLADTLDNKLSGFYRFCLGLSKKVFIANVMAAKADEIFMLPIEMLSTSVAWIGMLSYTFQIYFDFSGYSDMAIGIGKMIGFKFPENFDNPYTSKSITEFWRRWHITLGNWMRNYLYIPLGGNKVSSKSRLYFNLFLVFLASGLWHGAAWTFVFWGVYHGAWLILERVFLLKLYEKIPSFFTTLICFVIVAIGWVFFRADNLTGAFRYLKQLFVFDFRLPLHFINADYFFYLLIAFVFSFFTCSQMGTKIQNKIFYSNYNNLGHLLSTIVAVSLFILSVGAITSSDFNPFIYFRF